MKKELFPFIIGIIIAGIIGYMIPHTYQVKPTIVTKIVYVTPTPTPDCNSYTADHPNWGKATEDTIIFCLSHSTPTPTPEIIYKTQYVQPSIELPSHCNFIIRWWEAFGYNRELTNQMMKKDSPECTY